MKFDISSHNLLYSLRLKADETAYLRKNRLNSSSSSYIPLLFKTNVYRHWRKKGYIEGVPQSYLYKNTKIKYLSDDPSLPS